MVCVMVGEVRCWVGVVWGEGNNVRGKWDKFICLGERK